MNDLIKVMIPGAGYGQAILAKKAKDLGLYVVVVSPPGDYPGFAYADKTYHEDVRDRHAVLRIARHEAVAGIVGDQTDIPVETIGYVVEQLGLRGNDYSTSRLFTRKDLMRERCRGLGVPCIEHGTATTPEEAVAVAERIGYPVMCKPIDNQASKGVFRANDRERLFEGFGSALDQSFSGTVIVERFIEGPEYCVEGMAIDGQFTNLLTLERDYFKHDGVFVPSMVTSPTNLDARTCEELLELNRTICRGFGLRNGLSHSEFILSRHDGRFYLVETAARGAGLFISSHLVAHACQFDTAEFLIRLALGEKLKLEDYANRGRAVRYMCFYLAAGTIRDVHGVDTIKSLPGVIEFHDDGLQVGTGACGLIDKSSRLGPVLLGSANLDEIQRTTEAVRAALVISTEDRDNAVIWD